MLPNESTAAILVRTGGHAAVAIAPDADFEAGWAAWRTRGRAHERAVRRTLTLVRGVAGIVATAVAIAYMLLRPLRGASIVDSGSDARRQPRNRCATSS